jgi:pimeloyl-ACP methyl ester carboxylesterase
MPYATTNGVRLFYEELGSGVPLLLLSPTGWPGSVWQLEQVPALSQRYRVITYDQRGIGNSEKLDEEYTTTLLAQDALALLQALDATPAHIVGFSTGGQTGQLMALASPASVATLVLAGSNAGHIGGSGCGIPLGLAVGLAEHGYGPGYWMHHLADTDFPFSPAFRTAQPGKVQALARCIEARQPPIKLYLRHVLARVSHDTRDRLKDICVPTLVLVGAEDCNVASGSGDHVAASRLLASTIPSAEFATVPRAHHLFAWEEPEETNRLILDFLARH